MKKAHREGGFLLSLVYFNRPLEEPAVDLIESRDLNEGSWVFFLDEFNQGFNLVRRNDHPNDVFIFAREGTFTF
jgi:hypothetical protein